ncbi:glycerol-3-phosphate dehydrogenase [NAD(P)+] 2 domain protein [Mycobacterium ulcerans str. Harvey]|uniref:Glycerol-3-phosphate dehydrogenase [NAD(P)+] 2 domain protein n=1 Tax=Mycobacterium ulcerans str. Harvey TaxID=1299332 RepID=A0ABP3AHR1_MYCUL|nr:glycerol-3-phosphate dehydrogenase [NAD(P)+] 2 domain protein [Mycobacterium ulcerans str. Harvey]
MTSCESVLALASSYDVEMPLTDGVHRVCYKGLSVDDAIALLLGVVPNPNRSDPLCRRRPIALVSAGSPAWSLSTR